MRGVGVGDAQAYLNPRIDRLMPDPNALQDMERAASRLAEAVRGDEPIAVFGDYDVDGAASVALLVGWLRAIGRAASWRIPHRMLDGYGPSAASMRDLAKSHRLILVVDSGSSAEAAPAIAAAAHEGADVVVLDHHQCSGERGAAHAVVNPVRPDDESGLDYLCAAGVAFMLLAATNRKLRDGRWFDREEREPPRLESYLDLVALATVADVVPLHGLNRAFVRRGLREFRRNLESRDDGPPFGLAALARCARLGSRTDEVGLGWMLAPRLNAPGRIGPRDGDQRLAGELLLTEEAERAEQLAEACDRLNQDRKSMQERVIEDARKAIHASSNGGLLQWVAGPSWDPISRPGGWHPGVVGIAAGKLSEELRRPVIVLANDGEVARGSGRSIPGIDLGSVVRTTRAEGMLKRGGGHAAAVGLEVETRRLDSAMARVAELVEESAPLGYETVHEEKVVGAIEPSAMTRELCDLLGRAGPYGAGAPRPRFVLRGLRIRDIRRLNDRNYRLMLTDGSGGSAKGMAFGVAGTRLGEALADLRRGEVIDALGELAVDDFAGGDRAYLRVHDVILR